jgi:hypothetical protein
MSSTSASASSAPITIGRDGLLARLVTLCLSASAGAVAAVVLLMRPLAYAGVTVPSNIASLEVLSKLKGFKPVKPAEVHCVNKANVSDALAATIKRVTGEAPAACQYAGDSMHLSAFWGGVVALLLALVAIVAIIKLGKKKSNVNQLALVAGALAVGILAMLLRGPIVGALSALGLASEIFYNGAAAALMGVVPPAVLGWLFFFRKK